jgi:5-carboxymethyl-2-hydroxymuconate isomerase
MWILVNWGVLDLNLYNVFGDLWFFENITMKRFVSTCIYTNKSILPYIFTKIAQMPYITLEYSNNIKKKDFKPLFEDLKNQLVATGEVQELGVKCRAIPSSDYFITNGNSQYKMVHLLFRMREGRSVEVRQNFSKIGLAMLEKYFDKEIAAKEIILSTEVKELIKGLDLLNNSIR